jgi:hypothetical protein
LGWGRLETVLPDSRRRVGGLTTVRAVEPL